MSTLRTLAFNAWVKAQITKQKIKDHFSSEEGGADSIIIAVIIIIVVIALAVVFRDQIFGWFKRLSQQADGAITSADFTNTNPSSNGG